jgi:hypothetical protein
VDDGDKKRCGQCKQALHSLNSCSRTNAPRRVEPKTPRFDPGGALILLGPVCGCFAVEAIN